MTTQDFNDTLDTFKFKSNGPMMFGHDDKKLLIEMAKRAIDQNDLLFAIRYLIVAKYLENR